MNRLDIKIGTVVRLKGGGPAMTVACFIEDNGEPNPGISKEPTDVVRCLWFTVESELKSLFFRVGLLEGCAPDPWLGMPHYKVQTR